MKSITLTRLTGYAWIGTDSPGYLYADFPVDYPEHIADSIRESLIESVKRAYPGATVEVETDEIAWSA
jgi:hypothetical protein